jgi:hypothetical protein
MKRSNGVEMKTKAIDQSCHIVKNNLEEGGTSNNIHKTSKEMIEEVGVKESCLLKTTLVSEGMDGPENVCLSADHVLVEPKQTETPALTDQDEGRVSHNGTTVKPHVEISGEDGWHLVDTKNVSEQLAYNEVKTFSNSVDQAKESCLLNMSLGSESIPAVNKPENVHSASDDHILVQPNKSEAMVSCVQGESSVSYNGAAVKSQVKTSGENSLYCVETEDFSEQLAYNEVKTFSNSVDQAKESCLLNMSLGSESIPAVNKPENVHSASDDHILVQPNKSEAMVSCVQGESSVSYNGAAVKSQVKTSGENSLYCVETEDFSEQLAYNEVKPINNSVVPAKESCLLNTSEGIPAVDKPENICSVSADHILVQPNESETMFINVRDEGSLCSDETSAKSHVKTVGEDGLHCVLAEEPLEQLSSESHNEVKPVSSIIVPAKKSYILNTSPASESILPAGKPETVCFVSADHILVHSNKSETVTFSVRDEGSTSCDGITMKSQVEIAGKDGLHCADTEEPLQQLALESHKELMSRKSEHLPEPQPQPCEHVSSKTEESIVDQLLNYHRSLSEPVLKTLHQRVLSLRKLISEFKCNPGSQTLMPLIISEVDDATVLSVLNTRLLISVHNLQWDPVSTHQIVTRLTPVIVGCQSRLVIKACEVIQVLAAAFCESQLERPKIDQPHKRKQKNSPQYEDCWKAFKLLRNTISSVNSQNIQKLSPIQVEEDDLLLARHALLLYLDSIVP